MDHESNDSITIVDHGEGTQDLNIDQVQVLGKDISQRVLAAMSRSGLMHR